MIRLSSRIAFQLALPALAIAAWWWLSASSKSPYFPPLETILKRFAQTWFGPHLRDDVLPTLVHFAVGFSLALVLGVALGVVMGLSPRLRRCLAPLTEFMRATPVVALVPLGLVALGPGSGMEIMLIAFGSLWPILVAATDGVRGVDPLMLETGRVYGLSRAQQIRLIVLPAALPQIAAGVRVALAIAIAVTIIANMVGSTNGIGNFVVNAQQSFSVIDTWSGLLLIGFLGVAINCLFLLVQHHVLAWHRGWRGSSE